MNDDKNAPKLKYSIKKKKPDPGQPIKARIQYMGKVFIISGCYSTHEPDIIVYDFYSGTGASTIMDDWEPRELPNKPNAHPWCGITNKGIL